ncbi:terminase small subunit [Bacillus sp. FSL W7-1360]
MKLKLTEKQRRFADEYIRLGEVTKAAVNAGYSAKTAYAAGSSTLKKPAVKAYLDKRFGELKKKEIAEQDEILQFLTAVMRGEASGTALVGKGMGEQEVKQVPPALNEKVKAAEQLGKRYGMWTDKQDINLIVPEIYDDVPTED